LHACRSTLEDPLNWDLKRKMLKFVGAGHEYILHYIQAERKLEMIPAKGIAIGMIEDVAPLMVERQIKLADQDMLILFTDGVTESVMKDGGTELFGMERLNKLILKYLGEKNSREMYRKIIKELGEVSTQRDDVTLLILRRDESGDMVFEEDLQGIESIDLTTLKNLSRAEVEKSLQEISLEQKIKRLLLELKNMMQRGEYQLIINKCTAAIKQDKIYNKEVNLYLKKAKRYMIKKRERERKEMINTIYKMAREDFKEGEFLRAKMGLLKIAKLDEQNLNIKYLFKKVEKSILRYGNRRPKKKSKVQEFLDHLVLKLNLALSPVNKKDNIDFIVKLSSLVNSGIKVKESLMILIKQAKKESLKEMYRKMIANLGIL
jgi:Serine phosphatase RsbU, regulator of sigma subunit